MEDVRKLFNDDKEHKMQIIKNILWMIFDKIFLLCISLFVTVKIANYYGAKEYGLFQYGLSIIAILEVLITLVDARVVKKLYLSHQADEVVAVATIGRVIFSACTFLFGLVFIAFYNGGIKFNILFLTLLISTIVTDLRFGMANRFEYMLQSKRIVIASDISSFLGAVLQLFLVKCNLDILYLGGVTLLVSVTNLCVLFIQYKQCFSKCTRISLNMHLLKEVILESLPLAIAASCTVVLTHCDSAMLGTLLSSTEVGIYAVALKLVGITQIPLGPIRESVFPGLITLYEVDYSKYRKKYLRISSLLTWISIIGVLFSVWVVPFFLTVLNEEYYRAYHIFQILCLNTIVMYNAGLRAGHLTLKKRGNILMYSQLVCVVLNALLNFALINLWGMAGAACATVFTQVVSLMLCNLFFGEDGMEIFLIQLKAFNPYEMVRR